MNPTRQLINPSGNHTVQICSTESSHIDLVTRYIKEGLCNGEAVFVIARPALREILKLKMDALSFDGQTLQDPDQIRFFDADFILSCLKSSRSLDERAFQQILVAPILNAQSVYKKVRAFGEMVDILWKQGQHDMVIQLLVYWRKLPDTQKLSLLCTYSLDKVAPHLYDESLERICKYYPYLVPQKDYGSAEQGIDEAMINAFGAAWDRVINKLAS